MKSKRVLQAPQPANTEAIAAAEEVLKHGSKTALKKLDNAQLLALCANRLKMQVPPSTRDDALQKLSEFVGFSA